MASNFEEEWGEVVVSLGWMPKIFHYYICVWGYDNNLCTERRLFEQ